MTITTVFDRVKWVKGYLTVTEYSECAPDHTNKMMAANTFLTHGQKEPCHGMCSVGAIMWDLGATKPDYTNLLGTPYAMRSDYDRFVEDLRRYGVMIAQYYFRGYVEEFHHDYFQQIEEYDWDTNRPLIEGWNDDPMTTEQDVRNFLYTLETYPKYRQISRLLKHQDSDDLQEILEQANRLHEHGDFVNEWLIAKVQIFNQIFDSQIPACE